MRFNETEIRTAIGDWGARLVCVRVNGFDTPFCFGDIQAVVGPRLDGLVLPKLERERSLYGSEFEVRLRNELTQRAIAKECAEWIAGQVVKQ